MITRHAMSIVAACSAAAALSACTGIGSSAMPPPGSSSAPTPAVSVVDAVKAEIYAEAAFNQAVTVVQKAEADGLIRVDAKPGAEAAVQRGYKVLVAWRAAVDAMITPTTARIAAAVKASVDAGIGNRPATDADLKAVLDVLAAYASAAPSPAPKK